MTTSHTAGLPQLCPRPWMSALMGSCWFVPPSSSTRVREGSLGFFVSLPSAVQWLSQRFLSFLSPVQWLSQRFNRGFSQDQFLVWVKIIEKATSFSIEGDFIPGFLPFEGNLSHLEQGCVLQPFWAGHHFAKSHYGTEMGREMLANCCKI